MGGSLRHLRGTFSTNTVRANLPSGWEAESFSAAAPLFPHAHLKGTGRHPLGLFMRLIHLSIEQIFVGCQLMPNLL